MPRGVQKTCRHGDSGHGLVGMVVLCWQLDMMILGVFSNINASMIVLFYDLQSLERRVHGLNWLEVAWDSCLRNLSRPSPHFSQEHYSSSGSCPQSLPELYYSPAHAWSPTPLIHTLTVVLDIPPTSSLKICLVITLGWLVPVTGPPPLQLRSLLVSTQPHACFAIKLGSWPTYPYRSVYVCCSLTWAT